MLLMWLALVITAGNSGLNLSPLPLHNKLIICPRTVSCNYMCKKKKSPEMTQNLKISSSTYLQSLLFNWVPPLEHSLSVWDNGSYSNYSKRCCNNESRTVLWIRSVVKRKKAIAVEVNKEKKHTFPGLWIVIWHKQMLWGASSPSFCVLHTMATVFFIQHALCSFSSFLNAGKADSFENTSSECNWTRNTK